MDLTEKIWKFTSFALSHVVGSSNQPLKIVSIISKEKLNMIQVFNLIIPGIVLSCVVIEINTNYYISKRTHILTIYMHIFFFLCTYYLN